MRCWYTASAGDIGHILLFVGIAATGAGPHIAGPQMEHHARIGEVAVLAVAVALAGVGVAVCLLVVMLAPFVTVVGFETKGHRHQRAMLDNLPGAASS